MEWSRAKTILICMFMVLNIFLLLQFGQYMSDGGVSRETLDNTRMILENRGIRIAERINIPTYNKRTPMLVFKNSGFDAARITARLLGDESIAVYENEATEFTRGTKTVKIKGFTLTYRDTKPDTPLDLRDDGEVTRYLRNFCADMGISDDEFIIDRFEKGESKTSVLFTQKIKNFLIYDNYVLFELDERGITFMQYSYRDVEGLGKTSKDMDILPAHLILLKAFPKEEEAVIQSIDLGFKGYAPSGDIDGEKVVSDSQSPVWRIVVKDSWPPRFFKAYDGEEIK